MVKTPGLSVKKAANGRWQVIHDASGLPTRTADCADRSKAAAVAEAVALCSVTGVDWTQPADKLPLAEHWAEISLIRNRISA